MRDNMKPCQHTLSDDVIYKEVVVVGNGPSGLVTSFMLAGNVPYLKREIPEDLPIDEMLRARLLNLPPGQNLLETDLMELAEGLEGRSQNPFPLLMDNLLRPCADLGFHADPLIEWKYDVEKQVEHVVLGRGPPGGAWHSFPAELRTLSPAAWLALPPHTTISPTSTPSPSPSSPHQRQPARAVAAYCRRYVRLCNLQRFFRSGVIVTSVTCAPRGIGPPCSSPNCPRSAAFCVSGYDVHEGRCVRFVCSRVVLASGGADQPARAPAALAPYALQDLAELHRLPTELAGPALVVGSGLSAADAVRRLRGARVLHLHRAPPPALAALPQAAYPDYHQIYKMMCDGPSGNHHNYTPYPDHVVVEVTPLEDQEITDNKLCLKRVKLLNLVTNETTEVTVSLIVVLIGSRPDLFFLQTNFNLSNIDVKKDCIKCLNEQKQADKGNIDKANQRQCFLKSHWHYLKSVLGQSIQSCKSRYLNYTEINGNSDTKCIIPDCNKRDNDLKCKCNALEKVENGFEESKCEVIPYTDTVDGKVKCQCQPTNPYSSGLGFGVDPTKPVDGRSNPIAIDKSTHELLNAPKGIYALGPLTGDNFIRFIPGGALAIVADIHRQMKTTAE